MRIRKTLRNLGRWIHFFKKIATCTSYALHNLNLSIWSHIYRSYCVMCFCIIQFLRFLDFYTGFITCAKCLSLEMSLEKCVHMNWNYFCVILSWKFSCFFFLPNSSSEFPNQKILWHFDWQLKLWIVKQTKSCVLHSFSTPVAAKTNALQRSENKYRLFPRYGCYFPLKCPLIIAVQQTVALPCIPGHQYYFQIMSMELALQFNQSTQSGFGS